MICKTHLRRPRVMFLRMWDWVYYIYFTFTHINSYIRIEYTSTPRIVLWNTYFMVIEFYPKRNLFMVHTPTFPGASRLNVFWSPTILCPALMIGWSLTVDFVLSVINIFWIPSKAKKILVPGMMCLFFFSLGVYTMGTRKCVSIFIDEKWFLQIISFHWYFIR